MPDILVRHLDNAMAERIKEIARERHWSINDAILHALRHGLGLAGDEIARRDRQDIATLGGTWDASESAAFNEALEAFEGVEGTPLFEPPESS
jgi:hypothetical protein